MLKLWQYVYFWNPVSKDTCVHVDFAEISRVPPLVHSNGHICRFLNHLQATYSKCSALTGLYLRFPLLLSIHKTTNENPCHCYMVQPLQCVHTIPAAWHWDIVIVTMVVLNNFSMRPVNSERVLLFWIVFVRDSCGKVHLALILQPVCYR